MLNIFLMFINDIDDFLSKWVHLEMYIDDTKFYYVLAYFFLSQDCDKNQSRLASCELRVVASILFLSPHYLRPCRFLGIIMMLVLGKLFSLLLIEAEFLEEYSKSCRS